MTALQLEKYSQILTELAELSIFDNARLIVAKYVELMDASDLAETFEEDERLEDEANVFGDRAKEQIRAQLIKLQQPMNIERTTLEVFYEIC